MFFLYEMECLALLPGRRVLELEDEGEEDGTDEEDGDGVITGMSVCMLPDKIPDVNADVVDGGDDDGAS